MRAALLTAFEQPFSIEEVELLPLAADRVWVRTHASPFCHTDVVNWHGRLGKVPPTILGHASVGEIVAVGADVTGLSAGQRVVVPGTPECGACFYCASGRPDQCAELFDLGGVFPDVARTSRGELVSCAGCVGGYAETMSVSRNQVFPVETDLPSETLSQLGCGITTGFGSVFLAGRASPGESIVIVGAGQVGLWTLQAARLANPSSIVVIEPRADRRRIAADLGADVVIDPSEDDALERVRDATAGRGADVSIEVSGEPDAQRFAVLASRRAGRVVLAGLKEAGTEVTLPQAPLSVQGRTIVSVQNGNVRMRRDLPRLVRLLERGDLDPQRIVTSRYRLDEIDAARAASEDLADLTGVIVFDH